MTTFNDLVYGGTKGQPEPVVGMGVTLLYWTDRYPGTIVEVVPFKSGPNAGKARLIRFQLDTATSVGGDGMSESQAYVFAPDPDAPVRVATRRKGDAFREQTPDGADDGVRVRIGDRSKYRDPSF